MGGDRVLKGDRTPEVAHPKRQRRISRQNRSGSGGRHNLRGWHTRRAAEIGDAHWPDEEGEGGGTAAAARSRHEMLSPSPLFLDEPDNAEFRHSAVPSSS